MLQLNIISQDLFKSNDFMFRFDRLVLQHQAFFYNDYNVCQQPFPFLFPELNTSNMQCSLKARKLQYLGGAR